MKNKTNLQPQGIKTVDVRAKKTRHRHIWKYDGDHVRVCEAPIPTIESCGKEEWMTAFNGWVDAKDIIEARKEMNL
jgi:hypothetical protein